MDDRLQHEYARGERFIATGRVFLAVFAFIVLWLDPDLASDSPERLLPVAALFVTYAAGLLLIAHRFVLPIGRLSVRFMLQIADFAVFTQFIYLTHASVSPFFIFFLFSLITALLRFGVRGMEGTAAAAILVYVVMAMSDEQIRADPGYLIMRTVSLAVTTLLLGRLGTHYVRTRRELARLASWPRGPVAGREQSLREILDVARELLGVPRAILIWDEGEEPWTNVARQEGAEFALRREPPDFDEKLMVEKFRDETFLLRRDGDRVEVFSTAEDGRTSRSTEFPFSRAGADDLRIVDALSAPVRAQSTSGRIIFLDGDHLQPDDLVIAEVAARLVAASLDQLNAAIRSRNAAVAEERLRVGRDLHDGLLQSLTGVALQLETVSQMLRKDPEAGQQRLRRVQEQIVTDQAELRAMINELRPNAGRAVPSLEARLSELSRRFERQWDVQVVTRVTPAMFVVADALATEIFSTINEAVTNAAKHARPSRIDVEVSVGGGEVTMMVSNDGSGFPFHGRFTLAELNAERRGPVTLKERVASLGGDLVLDSHPDGARLDIRIPRGASLRGAREIA